MRTPNPHPGDPGSSLLEGATQGELWGLSLGSRLPLGIGQVSDRPAGCPWLRSLPWAYLAAPPSSFSGALGSQPGHVQEGPGPPPPRASGLGLSGQTSALLRGV